MVLMDRSATPPQQDPEEALETLPSRDAADERLDRIASRMGGDPASALVEVCRHVVTDRRYADSTRAVFAQILDQVRSALGQGGIR